MKEHTITWYEADDGTIFVDEWRADKYELNQLYKNSGVKLYVGDTPVNEFDYPENDFALELENKVTRMTIDRSKTEANHRFLDLYDRIRGVCFIGDALCGKLDAYGEVNYPFTPVLGTEYVQTPEEMICGHSRPIYDTDFVCTKQENVCPVCGKKTILRPYKVDEYSYDWICDVCRGELCIKA